MRSVRGLLAASLATLAVLACGLVFAGAPASAEFRSDVSPTVESESASPGAVEATLEALVNTANLATQYWFEYSANESDGVLQEPITTVQGAGFPPDESNNGETKASVTTGPALKAGETYYYRAVVENAKSDGTPTVGKVQSFTTAIPGPPIVDSESVSAVSATQASLEAKVNPNYQATSYTFDYSTKASGGKLEGTIVKVAGAEELPDVYGGQEASAVSGVLTPGTTYFYRVLAENEASKGTPTEGEVKEFTTVATPYTEAVDPSTITATTAAFSGTLTPLNAVVSSEYSFDYAIGGQCTDGQSTAPVSVGVGSGTFKVPSTPVAKLEPSQTYSVCLVSSNAFGSEVNPTAVSFTTLGEKPEIVSGSIHASTFGEGAQVELSAEINPNNQETSYFFEYSTEATGETLEGEIETSGGGPLPAGEFGPQGISVGAHEVHWNKDTYYYRLVVENAAGEKTESKIQAYTKIPIVEKESASKLALTSAALEATINPDWHPTTYQFEYAPSKEALEDGDGIKAPTGSVPGLEFVGATVSTDITGLSPYMHYFYRVVANNPSTENQSNADKGLPVVGTIEELTTRSLPVPNTGEAGSITRTSATLSGTVLAPFVPTAYYFEYITEAGYQAALARGTGNPYAEGESTVPVRIAGSEAMQAAGPVPASGLLPDTTYHYRLVAKNEFGWEYGQDHTFTTAGKLLPAVTTGGASGVSQDSATLSGTVGTNGLQTDYGFEIATEPGQYGPPTGLGSIGGAQAEAVSVVLSELQPGTTYYYRITASNDDGTTYGEPQTFATPGFPTLLAPQSQLSMIAVPNISFPPTSPESKATIKTKALTKAQKLANALKACKKDKSKHKRAGCEKQARKKYKAAAKKK
jgi:hypothetical protein